MIIEMPDDNSIVKWRKNENEDWKSAEISDLIKTYEERPQGEWKETDIPESTLCKCSVCNFDLGAYSFNFCPNCGADMRGEE